MGETNNNQDKYIYKISPRRKKNKHMERRYIWKF